MARSDDILVLVREGKGISNQVNFTLLDMHVRIIDLVHGDTG
jgi:hypothetical protein